MTNSIHNMPENISRGIKPKLKRTQKASTIETGIQIKSWVNTAH